MVYRKHDIFELEFWVYFADSMILGLLKHHLVELFNFRDNYSKIGYGVWLKITFCRGSVLVCKGSKCILDVIFAGEWVREHNFEDRHNECMILKLATYSREHT